ncbi:MAG: beta-lactamase family protein [Maribacter sp.]|nr:beta-lactamase family protein [Maribacter sp.]
MYAKPKMFFGFLLVLSMFLFSFSCNKEEMIVIVPSDGYDWPAQDRAYWPTDGWQTATLENYAIDSIKMEKANQFAKNDPLARALLVVKDGYIVYENYYGDGAVDASTNLWSVTKSFSSALVGILMDRDVIGSTDQLMADLMPAYPEFNTITLQHVLTMTTGLSWNEEGPLWVQWIFSDDWVAAALARGQVRAPGEQFYYSSGNSHFLMALVDHKTGEAPGKLAKEQLFDPMGIPFEVLDPPIIYNRWEEYMLPLEQSWRKDPNGIECASFGLYLTARDMAKFGYLYLNKGQWEGRQLLSEEWVETSTKDHETNIYGRYSYGYQWYLTYVSGEPAFLASGFGGQIIGVVPSLDLVVVLKYEAENPVHPKPGTAHDDMHLFELAVEAVK